jgi:hypothetical protein
VSVSLQDMNVRAEHVAGEDDPHGAARGRDGRASLPRDDEDGARRLEPTHVASREAGVGGVRGSEAAVFSPEDGRLAYVFVPARRRDAVSPRAESISRHNFRFCRSRFRVHEDEIVALRSRASVDGRRAVVDVSGGRRSCFEARRFSFGARHRWRKERRPASEGRRRCFEKSQVRFEARRASSEGRRRQFEQRRPRVRGTSVFPRGTSPPGPRPSSRARRTRKMLRRTRRTLRGSRKLWSATFKRGVRPAPASPVSLHEKTWHHGRDP